MRTSYRILSATIALGAVFPIGMPTAYADTTTEPAAAGAYYSRTTPQKDDALPTDPGGAFNNLNTDRVAPGHLAVAVTVSALSPTGSDKESFLRFDLLDVPFDATIDSAVVTVPLAPDDDKNKSLNAEPSLVKACAAGPEGFADADAGAYDEKPSVDCARLESFAEPTADGKAYSFDVTDLAKTWLTELNDGIALVPAKVDSAFQVVFMPADKATIVVQYTPLAPVVDAPVVEVPDFVPPVDSGGVAPPPDLGSGFQPVPAPAPAPAPAPVPAPRVVLTPEKAPIRRTAATVPFVEDNSLSGAFWVAAGLGVLLLGLTSLILGDDRVPVQTVGGDSQLDRVLRARQAKVAGGSAGRARSRLRTV